MHFVVAISHEASARLENKKTIQPLFNGLFSLEMFVSTGNIISNFTWLCLTQVVTQRTYCGGTLYEFPPLGIDYVRTSESVLAQHNLLSVFPCTLICIVKKFIHCIIGTWGGVVVKALRY
jgi:hypothetical protein